MFRTEETFRSLNSFITRPIDTSERNEAKRARRAKLKRSKAKIENQRCEEEWSNAAPRAETLNPWIVLYATTRSNYLPRAEVKVYQEINR